MNKKFGLLLLSCALLASCSPFEQAPIVDNEFKDTTDANNDGIGAIGDGKKLRQAALLDDPTRITFVQPQLGYQYKIDGGNISVRYVAAISSTNVEAVWTRTIYTNTGAVYKEAEERVSTKYYEAVINPNKDNNTEKAEDIVVDDDNPYVGFVVYTLLNVPLATYKDYHLSVSLTLTDINFRDNKTTSKVGNVYFGRYTDVKMVGTFNSGNYAFDKGITTDGRVDGNRYQKANVTLNAGDEFVFRDYDAAKDYGYDDLDAGDKPLFEEGSVENSLRVLVSGTYAFYLNWENKITVNSNLGYYLAKFEVDDWKITTNAIKADDNKGDNNAVFTNVFLTAGTKFQIINFSAARNERYKNYNIWDDSKKGFFYQDGSDIVSGYDGTYTFYENTSDKLYFGVNEAEKEKTIYLEAPDSWDNVHIHLFNGNDEKLANWPGVSMVKESEDLYKYTADITKWTKVVFNNGGDTEKTADLDIAGIKWSQKTYQ